jgi:uncharacterized protein involved in exopolysaccharide biosynthesis
VLPSLLRFLPPSVQRFLHELWVRRVQLVAFVLTVSIFSAGVSLVLPKWFTSEAKILPPVEGGENLGLMSALIENKALSRLGLFSATTPSDIYVEILRSRTLREDLARTFDLPQRYRLHSMEQTLKELNAHLRVSASPVGIVTVRVEDRDPRQAAEMTNHLVAALDRFNRESLNTRAKRAREFLEGRLLEAEARMNQAESTLTAYEQRNKVVASTEAAAVGAMAEVMSQKLGLEVRRSYMSSYTRPGSPALRELEAEIGAMERELAKLPRLRQQGSRLALEAEIQRRVFTLLTAQSEDARLQEMRDTPTLTVLDPGHVPEVRSRPRRTMIVVASTGAAMLLGVLWVGLAMRGLTQA